MHSLRSNTKYNSNVVCYKGDIQTYKKLPDNCTIVFAYDEAFDDPTYGSVCKVLRNSKNVRHVVSFKGYKHGINYTNMMTKSGCFDHVSAKTKVFKSHNGGTSGYSIFSRDNGYNIANIECDNSNSLFNLSNNYFTSDIVGKENFFRNNTQNLSRKGMKLRPLKKNVKQTTYI